MIFVFGIFVIFSFVAMFYFAGTETALCSLSPFQKRNLLKESGKISKGIALFNEDPNKIITTILVGNALAVIIASVCVQAISISVSKEVNFSPHEFSSISGFVLFVLVVFAGEILPKTLARKYPEKFSKKAVPFLYIIDRVFSPVANFFFFLSRNFLGIFRIYLSKAMPPANIRDFEDAAEIAYLFGRITKEERRIIKGIFDFPRKEVRQVMVPEVEVDAIDINWSREKILKTIAKYNHSRIPVYSENLDNIVGIIYTKDILNVLSFKKLFIINDILRQASFVPETAPVSKLLKMFKEGRQHLSVVVDEYGKVTGIITLEDVLEEITGDILDEFDGEVLYEKGRDGTYIVPAYEDVDRINEKLSLNLPAEIAESIGGIILEKLGAVPRKGEKVKFGNVELEVFDADRQKIKTVKIKIS
ncbi:MAG: HlyC/CorC family transporter [Elusimicrobia bacterium]|nr:HlyC/CorC family transporter [Elusimicrobiota bacterium]